ncbi:hypothetical protein K438DRAFT_2015141 [Mycena galopus ATCC 62051]|nr:hypothetical protein K438DRAFT_2015141 [Mycena galopus ATCC 62051]
MPKFSPLLGPRLFLLATTDTIAFAQTSDPFVLPPLPNRQLMDQGSSDDMEHGGNGSESLDELIKREAKEWFKGMDCCDNYWLNSARSHSRTVFEASCTSSSPSPALAATLHSGVFGPTVHEPIDMGSVTDAEER